MEKEQESSSGDSGESTSESEETDAFGGSSFASQFEDGLDIDSASDGGDGDLLDQFDDGFAEQGVGDDVIPTYDLETLEEIGDAGFVKTKASAEAEAARAAQRQGDKVRVGTMKRANPLDELRSVFKTSGGLKLSRDFTERYLFKISADGYHVGWVKDAGSDYDFYNTKHEIVHTEEKTEMPQLSNPKLLGSGDPSGEILAQLKKAYKCKVELIFTPDTSCGYMQKVTQRDGKHLGWSCKSGRDVHFFDTRGKFLTKVPQRHVPKLSVGERDVMKEVRRAYGLTKVGVRLKSTGSRKSKFKYEVILKDDKYEKTGKEKQLGWANISSGYYLFFDKEGKKRLHAISRYEMPSKDRWRGHSKAFGISKELQTTAAGTDYSEKGTKPQGIFGLMDVNEIPGFTDDGKQASVDADGKKKKKKKKTKKSTKKTKTKMVQKVQIAGIF